jgi:hypothetical protein
MSVKKRRKKRRKRKATRKTTKKSRRSERNREVRLGRGEERPDKSCVLAFLIDNTLTDTLYVSFD